MALAKLRWEPLLVGADIRPLGGGLSPVKVRWRATLLLGLASGPSKEACLRRRSGGEPRSLLGLTSGPSREGILLEAQPLPAADVRLLPGGERPARPAAVSASLSGSGSGSGSRSVSVAPRGNACLRRTSRGEPGPCWGRSPALRRRAPSDEAPPRYVSPSLRKLVQRSGRRRQSRSRPNSRASTRKAAPPAPSASGARGTSMSGAPRRGSPRGRCHAGRR